MIRFRLCRWESRAENNNGRLGIDRIYTSSNDECEIKRKFERA